MLSFWVPSKDKCRIVGSLRKEGPELTLGGMLVPYSVVTLGLHVVKVYSESRSSGSTKVQIW